jgi:hypothetical protein
MEKYLRHPQLLLIGILGSSTSTAGKIEAMLTPELKARIVNRQDYVLKKDDPWAKEQRLVVLVAAHLDTLKQRLADNRDELFELFNQPLLERTKKEMYSRFEQTNLEKNLFEKYGWTLRIQHDYQLYKEFPPRQAFLVDIAVFNPGKEKVRFLRQLEIMARTFETR